MTLWVFIKGALTPGSPLMFGAGLLAAYLLRRFVPSRPRLSQICFLTVAAVYVAMSSPLVANRLGDALLPPATYVEPASRPIDMLVVIDGDNRRGRVHESLHLWETCHPPVIEVLGAEWIVDELSSKGVPTSRIRQEWRPSTTREQIVWVQQYLAAHPGARLTLVASRLQVPRIRGLMQMLHVDADLRAAPADAEPPRSGMRLLLPTYTALRVSRDAIYELVAIVYYRHRGWIP